MMSKFQYGRYFLEKFRVPSLDRKASQPYDHRHRIISKYKLWYALNPFQKIVFVIVFLNTHNRQL